MRDQAVAIQRVISEKVDRVKKRRRRAEPWTLANLEEKDSPIVTV